MTMIVLTSTRDLGGNQFAIELPQPPPRELGFDVGDIVDLDGSWVRVTRIELSRDLMAGAGGGLIRSAAIAVESPRMLPPGGFM